MSRVNNPKGFKTFTTYKSVFFFVVQLFYVGW